MIGYISNDGQLQSEIGFITIVVAEINDPPIAQNMLITLYEDNLYNFEFTV